MNIRLKYLDKEMANNPELQLKHIGGKKRSNWIDLRVSRVKIDDEFLDFDYMELYDKNGEVSEVLQEAVIIPKGSYIQVYTGFAMELPENYEALVAPRGSTFKNFGVLQTNSVGVVDETYCGDNDEWFIPFLAMDDIIISKYDRMAQFRIQEVMPDVEFIVVEHLGNADRGGYGKSGTK